MIVYKITNIVNGKVYVGQTVGSLKNRWTKHSGPNSQCSYLKQSIAKYGKDKFKIEQIDSAASREELLLKEEYWINYYNTLDREFGYNLKKGGVAPTHSEETKLKMSKSGKGRRASLETIEKMRKAQTGKKHSIETRNKIAENNRNRPKRNHSQETIEKIRKAHFGKKQAPHTEEHKKKISESMKIFKKKKRELL